MIYVELFGMALVLGGIYAMSEGRFRLGFWCSGWSAVVWSTVAVDSSLWGLLVLQIGIFAAATRGLLRVSRGKL